MTDDEPFRPAHTYEANAGNDNNDNIDDNDVSDNRKLVFEQFLKHKTNRNQLRVAFLLSHPNDNDKVNQRVPNLKTIWQHFQTQVKRVHKLVNMHKRYLAQVPDRQKVALDQWQSTSANVNSLLNSGRMDVSVYVDAKISPEQARTRQGIMKAIQDSIPVDEIQFNLREAQQAVRSLKPLVAHAPRLPEGESYMLYRGVHVPAGYKPSKAKSSLNVKAGQVLDWAAFSSFSISPLVALNFGSPPCCIFRLQWTHKVPGLVIPLNGRFSEFEVVVPPGKFKVVRVWYVKSPYDPDYSLRVLDLEYSK